MSPLASLDRNMPILVVDDLPTMRKVVKNCLRQLGFSQVSDVENGEAALGLLAENRFQLIISDWHMPGMMGIDLLKVLRQNHKFQETPFLMVTAEAQKSKVAEVAEKEHFSYIVKPFTSEVLEKKILEAFSSSPDAHQ